MYCMQIAKIKNNELVLYCLQLGNKIASCLIFEKLSLYLVNKIL